MLSYVIGAGDEKTMIMVCSDKMVVFPSGQGDILKRCVPFSPYAEFIYLPSNIDA